MANRDPGDEPCFLTPADDPFLLDSPRVEPVGPDWWEGHWPEGGINSLEELERWIDGRLNEMIDLNRAYPGSLGKIALDGGRQAVKNAARYLGRLVDGDPPRRPKLDQAAGLEDVEEALEGILRHIRRELAGARADGARGPGGLAGVPVEEQRPDEQTVADGAGGPVRGDGPDLNRLVVDRQTFSAYWKGKTCRLGYNNGFRVLEHLAQHFEKYVSVSDLKEAAWGSLDTEDNTVQRTVSNLRKRLAEAGVDDLIVDGSQPGYYRVARPA